jgi:thiosulfate dehydrogenase
VKFTRYIVSGICITALIAIGYFFSQPNEIIASNPFTNVENEAEQLWVGPADDALELDGDSGKLIAYGRELIANTARYLGPRGSVLQISNGMNCQNCHLDAGTRPWGNNYGGVYSTYPKMRNRSGSVEDIYKRVNDCMQRSLNGKELDTTGREINAIYAYFKWLGKNVPRGLKPAGAGLEQLPFLDRAADSVQGRLIYVAKCQLCHGAGGQGKLNPDGLTYLYPPLWGDHSYTKAAGLYRLSRFAGYVYNNMPFGVTWKTRQLTAEEAWDVAAFVNSRPRPVLTFSRDWPDISKKPIDHPFGPYADSFPQEQHQFGPFGPIAASREKK